MTEADRAVFDEANGSLRTRCGTLDRLFFTVNLVHWRKLRSSDSYKPEDANLNLKDLPLDSTLEVSSAPISHMMGNS